MSWRLSALLLLGACATPVARDVPPAVSRRASAAVERHCGRCHIGTLDTALPRALAIYDLTEGRWWERVPDAALPHLVTRMQTLADGHAPETAEPDLEMFGGQATLDDVRDVQALVDAERERRAAR